MYHRYFGLEEQPFSIAVNPKYLFMSGRHRDALAHLLYGVGAGGGFILLTGEVGTGKTTINRALMQQLPEDTDIAVVLNPALNAEELLASVCDELNIDYPREGCTLKTLTDALHRFLLDNHTRGRNTVLLIDEAQHLQFEVLEQIRLLTNLETNTRKLLQIILVGQPELSEILSRPELRQLNQRITARYDLQPLNREETDAYIRHRLQVAGLPASQEIFPSGVVKEIHRLTDGIPRVINVLCDRILLGAYGHGQSKADRKTLRQAAAEVFGSGSQPPAESSRLGLAAALMLGLLLASVAWYVWRPTGPVASLAVVQNPAPAPAASMPAAAVVEQQTAVPAEPPAAAPVPVLEPGPEPVLEPVQVQAEALDFDSLAPGENYYEARWQALVELGRLVGNSPLGDCNALAAAGLLCEEGEFDTWDELLAYNQPAVLSLATPERFARYVVLVGISGTQALIRHEGSEYPVALAELGQLWQGGYLFLWRPPEGYSAPFRLGARGPVVRWLAQGFAQLDGQDTPLAEETFNSALDQRVRLFQRQFQLRDDGVVGVKTLLKLSEQLGQGPYLQRPQAALVPEAG